MEPSEREHIRSNKNRLVDTLIYNQGLISYLEQAGHLGPRDIEQLKAEYRNHENSNAIMLLLEILVTKPGSYKSLIEATHKEVQTGATPILEELYQGPKKAENNPVKKYWQVPHGLQQFLKSESMYCIISTLDCEITCDKIREKEKNSEIHEWKDFKSYISNSDNPTDNAVYVANNCSLKELKQLNKLRDRKLNNKKVLVTSEDAEKINSDVLERLPSWKAKVTLIYDNMDWDDLESSHQDEITEKLEEKYGIQFDEEEELLNGQILVDLIKGKEIKLFQETLPEELSYYVERTVSPRTKISVKIFEQNSQDIFIFSGIKMSELSSLAKSKLTGTSTNQLQQTTLTVNFMIMDQSNHFEQIAKKAPASVHLICHDNGRLTWIKSKGNLKMLQECVERSQDKLPEDKFILNLGSECNHAVIISDSPGMGKSVLLEKIGGRLERKHPGRTVLFLGFNQFIGQLMNIKCDELLTKIIMVLEKMTCENDVGKAVLRNTINSDLISIELLMDGFDELDSTHFDLACEVLQALSSIKAARLWVTSRPHLLEELENKLNVLGHNIHPFQEEHQVKFLSSYWSRDGQAEQKNLENFARDCLKNLKMKMDTADHDVAGIPLQCRLLGDIFQDEAISNVKSEHAGHQPVLINNITDLYKLLIDKKFEKYFEVHAKESLHGKAKLMEMHVRLSLELIFPEYLDKLNGLLCPVDLEELPKVGIMESSSTESSPRFLHRTFAEYFVAWFVVDKLESEESWNDIMTHFLIEWVLRCKINSEKFRSIYPHNMNTTESDEIVFGLNYAVIAYFINALVSNLQFFPFENFRSSIRNCQGSETTGMKIAHSCSRHNFHHILKYLDSAEAFKLHSSVIFSKKCLLLSIDYAQLELVTYVLQHFENFYNWSPEVEIQAEVLHRAIGRGKFYIVEFLIKKKGLQQIVKELEKGFLHICVRDTLDNSPSEIEERVQIMNLLVDINERLLKETVREPSIFVLGATPLLEYNVHLQLRIKLIRLGSDVLATESSGDTILQKIDCINSSEEYHILVKTLSDSNTLKKLINKKNLGKVAPLVKVIRFYDLLPETLKLCYEAGADLNITHDEGFSLLAFALSRGRNGETLRTFIKYGSDVSWTNDEGAGLLHIAAMKENREATEILVQENCLNVNGQDKNGNTALHYVAKSRYPRFEYTKLLLELGANPNMSNDTRNTPFQTLLEGIHIDFMTAQLLKSKTDVIWTPALAHSWIIVICQNEVENVETELAAFEQECANQGVAIDLNHKDENENSMLHNAAKYSYNVAVKFLVEEKGFDVNLRNIKQQTVLHVAATGIRIGYNLNNIIKYLIEQGAEVYAIDKTGLTFLHQYVLQMTARTVDPNLIFDLPELAKYLVTTGYSSLFEVTGGVNLRTPVHLLFLSPYSSVPDVETLTSLSSLGVNFNIVNQHGYSLFHYAIIKKKNTRSISSLIHLGADWKVLNKHKSSVLHTSAQFSESKVLKLFLELGELDVNGVDEDGNTALHCAVKEKRNREDILESCKLLIEYGADINIKNKEGDTPLALAMKTEFENDQAELLITLGLPSTV